MRPAPGPAWDWIFQGEASDIDVEPLPELPEGLEAKTMEALRPVIIKTVLRSIPPVMPLEEFERFFTLSLDEQEAYLRNYEWEKFVKKPSLKERVYDWLWNLIPY